MYINPDFALLVLMGAGFVMTLMGLVGLAIALPALYRDLRDARAVWRRG